MWEPTVQHMGLYTELCGELNGKESQKREDTCMHTADSLCSIAETNRTM